MRPTKDSITKSLQTQNKKHIIITGHKGSGKTTLFHQLKEESLPGLTSTFLGDCVVLKDNLSSREMVIGERINGKMQCVSSGFNELGVAVLDECLQSASEWIGIDEIGFLESHEENFKAAIRHVFDQKRVIAVLRKEDLPFLNELQSRNDVLCIDMDNYHQKVAAIIMASGLSKRFGQNKLLAKIEGKTLLEITLEKAKLRCFDTYLVVTRNDEVHEYCLAHDIPVLFHQLPFRNEAIALGVKQLKENDAIVFLQCDQPLLQGQSIETIIQTFISHQKGMVRLAYQQNPSSPVLFAKCYFDALQSLPAKKGGSLLCSLYPEDVLLVEANHPNELLDVDTPEDLEKIQYLKTLAN